jgi:hypothetical protein
MDTKDIVQIGAWLAAIVGGLVAAFKAIHETGENRRLRQQELRWKKAQLAREILNNLKTNPRFHDALVMLDWSGREYEISSGIKEEVSWEELPGALRAWSEEIEFSDKEVYIRDCFDELFDGLNILEHYLRTDFLEFEDVNFPLAYYMGKLHERIAALDVYLTHYDFQLAAAFIQRYR